MTHKSVLQECPTRVSLQEFPRRVSYKSLASACRGGCAWAFRFVGCNPSSSMFIDRKSIDAGESAICPMRAQASLCGDRACRVRERQARVRFVPRARNPLRRSCVLSARNAGESAICPVELEAENWRPCSTTVVRGVSGQLEAENWRPCSTTLVRGVSAELEESPTRVSRNSVPLECLKRVSLKSVLQEYPTRVSYKSVPQECPTRVSYKTVPQEYPTRVSHKEFHKSVPQSDPQDCPTRVSYK